MNDKLNALYKRRNYIEKVLSLLKKYIKVIPILEKLLDRTNWEINAIEKIPEEASDFPTEHLYVNLGIENDILFKSVPLTPTINYEDLYYMTTTSGSASSDLYELVSRIGEIDSPSTKRYYYEQTETYKEFQNKYNIFEEINNQLTQLHFKSTKERFNTAFDNLQKYKNGIVDGKSTAMSIRTFVDGLKGELWELARNHKGDNMNWDILENRFSSILKDQLLIQTIKSNLSKYESLIKRISPIGKGMVEVSVVGLESIWIEVLDWANSFLKIAILYQQKKQVN